MFLFCTRKRQRTSSKASNNSKPAKTPTNSGHDRNIIVKCNVSEHVSGTLAPGTDLPACLSPRLGLTTYLHLSSVCAQCTPKTRTIFQTNTIAEPTSDGYLDSRIRRLLLVYKTSVLHPGLSSRRAENVNATGADLAHIAKRSFLPERLFRSNLRFEKEFQRRPRKEERKKIRMSRTTRRRITRILTDSLNYSSAYSDWLATSHSHSLTRLLDCSLIVSFTHPLTALR